MATTAVKIKPEVAVEDNDDDFTIDPALKAILDGINAQLAPPSKKSNIAFLKNGEHIIKFVFPTGRDLAGFFQAYQNEYNGKVSTSYLVTGVILKSDQEDLIDKTKVRYIKAPVSLVKGITSLLASGFPLFEDSSPVVKVRIYKDAGDMTKYEVTSHINPKTGKIVSFDASSVEFPEMTIEEVAKDAEEFSMKKAGTVANLPFVVSAKGTAVDLEY